MLLIGRMCTIVVSNNNVDAFTVVKQDTACCPHFGTDQRSVVIVTDKLQLIKTSKS